MIRVSTSALIGSRLARRYPRGPGAPGIGPEHMAEVSDHVPLERAGHELAHGLDVGGRYLQVMAAGDGQHGHGEPGQRHGRVVADEVAEPAGRDLRALHPDRVLGRGHDLVLVLALRPDGVGPQQPEDHLGGPRQARGQLLRLPREHLAARPGGTRQQHDAADPVVVRPELGRVVGALAVPDGQQREAGVPGGEPVQRRCGVGQPLVHARCVVVTAARADSALVVAQARHPGLRKRLGYRPGDAGPQRLAERQPHVRVAVSLARPGQEQRRRHRPGSLQIAARQRAAVALEGDVSAVHVLPSGAGCPRRAATPTRAAGAVCPRRADWPAGRPARC